MRIILLTILAASAALAQAPALNGGSGAGAGSGLKVPNAQTGTSYTLTAADCGRVVKLTNAASITLTVPTSLGAGCFVVLIQGGAGTVTPTASGTTILQRDTLTHTDGQYAVAMLVPLVADTYLLTGDLQ